MKATEEMIHVLILLSVLKQIQIHLNRSEYGQIFDIF